MWRSRRRGGTRPTPGRASEADLAAARIKVRRTAGQLYAALRGAQASRAAAEQQTRDATASLALAQAQANAGLDSNLAVAQAQSAADAARARIPGFVHAETQARLGLEALFGVRPGAFLERLAPADSAPIDARAFMDAPAAVIERRPDIQAAAARLAAAGLDARAARADRWPTLGLTLSALQTSATRAAFGDVVGSSGAATLTLAATLFDFGRLDALADAADARAEAAAYRRTVTYAVADVEREADRLARAIEERDAARAARDSAREQARLAAVRCGGGLSSFVEVSLAERAAADAAITLAAAEARALDAGVSLAAALGLGQAPSSSAGAAVQ